MEHYSKVCINCPAGCHLEITRLDNGEITVSGNRCPRGDRYARTELTDPRRVVTAAIPVAGSVTAGCLPVKTTAPLPVKLIPDLLKKLYALKIKLPVELGSVVLPDVAGIGIDVVATRSLK